MNVFIDCKCKQCGKFVQVWFDDDSEKLYGTECKSCGTKLSEAETELIWHACDTLLSMKEHVQTFKVGRVHFIGHQRAKRSNR